VPNEKGSISKIAASPEKIHVHDTKTCRYGNIFEIDIIYPSIDNER